MLRAKQQTGKTGNQLVNVMRLQSQTLLWLKTKTQSKTRVNIGLLILLCACYYLLKLLRNHILKCLISHTCELIMELCPNKTKTLLFIFSHCFGQWNPPPPSQCAQTQTDAFYNFFINAVKTQVMRVITISWCLHLDVAMLCFQKSTFLGYNYT